jgi:hypothetical protein
MRDERLQRLWEDPANWTAIGLYRSADDPRWWVPKRQPWMGWTINIAHRGAVLSLIGLMVAATVPPILLVLSARPRSPALLAVTVGMPVLLVIGFVGWLGTRDS